MIIWRFKPIEVWRSYFALFPVWLRDDRVVWFEMLERRGRWVEDTIRPWVLWEYRRIYEIDK